MAGKRVVVDYLRQRARPFLFSNAVTAADTAACKAAVEVLSASTQLVDRLWDNTKYFKGEMSPADQAMFLADTRVVYVLVGPRELELGQVSAPGETVFEAEGMSVFHVDG